MGIVETDLAEFELTELNTCKIEQDTSGVIHLHLGSIRLELTPEEFDHFVTVIDRGRAQLRELKQDSAHQSHPGGTEARDSGGSSGATELTDDQRDALLDVFERLRDRRVPYVVLRGYDDLPDRIKGSDVDLLVDAGRFDDAVEAIRARFAPSEPRLANALDIVEFGARNPLIGVRTLLESPEEVARYVRRNLVATEVGGRNYIERTFEHEGLVVHLVNHLTYVSPMNGDRFRVAAEVDGGLLERRIDHGDFFVPAPPDELAHLVCRGVFDYEGVFPDRYAARCDELRPAVFGDSRTEQTFKMVLSHLFYGAAPLVENLVRNGEYDSIRSRVASYDDY